MAAARRKKKTGRGWPLFWLAFFVGVTLLFMINLERIKATLQETRVLEHFFRSSDPETEEIPSDLGQRIQDMDLPSLTNNETAGQTRNETPRNEASGQNEASRNETPGSTSGNDKSQTEKPPTEKSQLAEKPALPAVEPKMVERSLYLMKVDNAGSVYGTAVKRKLPASDSPLLDALESLIRGPSMEEEKQGLISLIPKNAKILNATVRGNTAYINFSEDFLFNTYGTEGYASQRRQVVLTATQFSNVNDVQILIDGKRIDYLGEGVWIGGPIKKDDRL